MEVVQCGDGSGQVPLGCIQLFDVPCDLFHLQHIQVKHSEAPFWATNNLTDIHHSFTLPCLVLDLTDLAEEGYIIPEDKD